MVEKQTMNLAMQRNIDRQDTSKMNIYIIFYSFHAYNSNFVKQRKPSSIAAAATTTTIMIIKLDLYSVFSPPTNGGSQRFTRKEKHTIITIIKIIRFNIF